MKKITMVFVMVVVLAAAVVLYNHRVQATGWHYFNDPFVTVHYDESGGCIDLPGCTTDVPDCTWIETDETADAGTYNSGSGEYECSNISLCTHDGACEPGGDNGKAIMTKVVSYDVDGEDFWGCSWDYTYPGSASYNADVKCQVRVDSTWYGCTITKDYEACELALPSGASTIDRIRLVLDEDNKGAVFDGGIFYTTHGVTLYEGGHCFNTEGSSCPSTCEWYEVNKQAGGTDFDSCDGRVDLVYDDSDADYKAIAKHIVDWDVTDESVLGVDFDWNSDYGDPTAWFMAKVDGDWYNCSWDPDSATGCEISLPGGAEDVTEIRLRATDFEDFPDTISFGDALFYSD